MLKWNEVKWSEMKWNEVKWSEMKWNEVKWSEMKWNEVKWNEIFSESVYSSDFFCVRIVRPSWDCQKKPLPSSSNNCNTRCAISTPSAGSAAGKFSCSLATSTRRASLVETTSVTSFSTLHAGQLQRKPYLKMMGKHGENYGKTYDNNWAKSWWKWQKP